MTKTTYYPTLEDSQNRLKKICETRLEELYGSDIPEEVSNRVQWELEALHRTEMEGVFLILHEVLRKCGIKPHCHGYRGNIGYSFVAYLLEITDVNPLEWNLNPWFCMGKNGDKAEYIHLNLAKDHIDKVQNELSETEGVAEVIYAVKSNNVVGCETGAPCAFFLIPKGMEAERFAEVKRDDAGKKYFKCDYHDMPKELYRIYLFEHDGVTMMNRLFERTGVSPTDININDSEISSLLPDGLEGLQESYNDLLKKLVTTINVKSFNEMIKVEGLAHGAGTWDNNAELLIDTQAITVTESIAFRDDVYDILADFGIEEDIAWEISEAVRKGKVELKAFPRWDYLSAMIAKEGVPLWFIVSCERIGYLFPKAHALEYVLMEWRLLYFKRYFPNEFNEEFYKIRGKCLQGD